MATLPKATVKVSATAGAGASGLDVICVMAPVPLNADMVPRRYGSADAIAAFHGYARGISYCAMHFDGTGLAVLFCGLPIATPGVIGRENKTGNTGSCVTTISAGGSGVLGEHDGILSVVKGGVIGTDQIILGLSLDGGRRTVKVRLGTGNSYTDPYYGFAVAFGAGSLNTGDTIHTWHGSEPLSDSSSWTTARGLLASQLQGFRSIMLIGDLPDSTAASAFLTEIDSYKTANDRFVYGRCSARDRLPYATMSKAVARMTGGPTITFVNVGASGDTITRSAGSFVSDGFTNGDWIRVTGTASNNVSGSCPTVAATVLTLGTLALAAEGPVGNVVITSEMALTFTASTHTITRNRGSWFDDGFRVGDSVTTTGTASNNFTKTITAAGGIFAARPRGPRRSASTNTICTFRLGASRTARPDGISSTKRATSRKNGTTGSTAARRALHGSPRSALGQMARSARTSLSRSPAPKRDRSCNRPTMWR
jgi:hypothetical protein